VRTEADALQIADDSGDVASLPVNPTAAEKISALAARLSIVSLVVTAIDVVLSKFFYIDEMFNHDI
jgi:hypothetical protein